MNDLTGLLIAACLACAMGCVEDNDSTASTDATPATDATVRADATVQDDAAVPDAGEPDAADADLSRDPVMFLTRGGWDIGGGIAGADRFCMTNDANPGAGTFKALLGGTQRSVCATPDCADGASPVDWVLQPETTYTRVDGTVMFTTNADGIFTDWPMPEQFAPGINQASGLNTDWTVRDGLHCDDWTTQSEAPAGVGWTATLDAGFLNGGMLKCQRLPLVCVEQR